VGRAAIRIRTADDGPSFEPKPGLGLVCFRRRWDIGQGKVHEIEAGTFNHALENRSPGRWGIRYRHSSDFTRESACGTLMMPGLDVVGNMRMTNGPSPIIPALLAAISRTPRVVKLLGGHWWH